MSVAVYLVRHHALEVVDEWHVAHCDLRLLFQQCLTRVLRVHRVCEFLVDVDHVAECEIARAK